MEGGVSGGMMTDYFLDLDEDGVVKILLKNSEGKIITEEDFTSYLMSLL